MRIATSRPIANTASAPVSPRLYFVHIPKTAGITLKVFLENNYAYGESLVIHEWEARKMAPEALRQYRLLSGHYSSEVLTSLGERPDVTLMLVREPVSRFRSWMAHCRRLSDSRYRDVCEGQGDLDVLTGPDGYTCHQAHWLARAVHEGSSYTGVPSTDELVGLLQHVDIVGITEEIERFMQLVSFRNGWPPPQLGWHINRRPAVEPSSSADVNAADDDDVRRELAVDTDLYEMVQKRFWDAYAGMLSTIAAPQTFTAATAATLSLETVQEWLRRHYEDMTARTYKEPVNSIAIDGDRPIAGEGWWWREHPMQTSYRWSGPACRATLVAAPLVEGHDYMVTVDAMGAADWQTWEGVGLEVNGRTLDAVHERFAPREPGRAGVRLRARLTPEVVHAQRGLTRIAVTVPETKPALAHVRVEESFDTFKQDTRQVGLAVQSVRVERMPARVVPALSVRRTSAA